MVYLIYGDQELMIKKRLQNLKKERLNEEVCDFNFVHFDARETSLDTVFEEIETIPFGHTNRMIVYDFAYFLEKESDGKNNSNTPKMFDRLIQYIAKPFKEVELVLIARSSKLNETNKVVKALRKDASIIEILNVTKSEWPIYVRKYLAQYYQAEISDEAITELGERINFNITQFVNEAIKLANYTKKISLETVKALTPKPLEDEVFTMINCLISGKTARALEIFYDLKKNPNVNQPVRLILLIGGQLRTLSLVLYLRDQSLSLHQIASTLNLDEYRVRKILENAHHAKLVKVYTALDRLYELDYQIKGRLYDGFYGLELFLLQTQLR